MATQLCILATCCFSIIAFFFFFFSPLLEENKTKCPRISCWHAYSINEPPFPLACLVLELLSAKTFSIYVLAICVKERWEKDHQDKKRGQIWGGKENMLWETEWEVRLLKERSGKKNLVRKEDEEIEILEKGNYWEWERLRGCSTW